MDSNEHGANLRLIEHHLSSDPLASEFKWVLFNSTLRSYKKESLLKPFPTHYGSADQKDFHALLSCANSLPYLAKLKLDSLSPEQACLLAWVLESKSVTIKSARLSKFEELCKLTKASGKCPPRRPQFVFELEHSQVVNRRFALRGSSHPTLFAYHGSQLPNFHSIIHHGLVSHLNKMALFGEGTYLSNELSVSLHWSPPSNPGLPQCSFGDRLSCVALCQVINDPGGVRLDVAETGPRRSFNNRIPQEYVVVRNDALLQVKYLLLYAEKSRSSWGLGRATQNWIQRNQFWLCIAAYALMLASVGLLNSRGIKLYLKRWSNYFSLPPYEET